jgi:hypothetical protein
MTCVNGFWHRLYVSPTKRFGVSECFERRCWSIAVEAETVRLARVMNYIQPFPRALQLRNQDTLIESNDPIRMPHKFVVAEQH